MLMPGLAKEIKPFFSGFLCWANLSPVEGINKIFKNYYKYPDASLYRSWRSSALRCMPPPERPARSLCFQSQRFSPCHSREASLQVFFISFHPSKEIFTSFGVDLAKPVVTHLVHQTVQHSAASLSINSEIISNIKVSSRKISYQLLSFINVLSVVHSYQSCRKSSTREGRILININFSSHSIYFFSGLSFLSVV